MPHLVLGIGYGKSERELVRHEWQAYRVDFHFVDSTEEAVRLLRQEDYVCVTVCTGRINHGQIEILRSIKPVPIVVVSPEFNVSKRADAFQRGAIEFILNVQHQNVDLGSKDFVQCYLDIRNKAEAPLTIITYGELYFCLEYRTVEIRGQGVNLTAKEFDLLALMIMHPKRVYTFEMIMDLVWGEDYAYFSRKTLINHMSNLRQKLKIHPSVPNYIVNIHGVGYKFDLD